MAARASGPDWLVLASSSEAHAARLPTPGGQGAAAAPWAQGHGSRECCPALRSQCPRAELRTATQGRPLESPPAPGWLTHAQNAGFCPPRVSGVSASPAPAGAWEAGRGWGRSSEPPLLREPPSKRRSRGAQSKGGRSSREKVIHSSTWRRTVKIRNWGRMVWQEPYASTLPSSFRHL